MNNEIRLCEKVPKRVREASIEVTEDTSTTKMTPSASARYVGQILRMDLSPLKSQNRMFERPISTRRTMERVSKRAKTFECHEELYR